MSLNINSVARPYSYSSGRRKIFSYKSNATASVDLESVTHLETSVKEHAELRIQLFYIKALALWKKATRTEGSPAKLRVWVDRARAQGGRSQVKGVHAAHADANAGLTDDRRMLIVEELLTEQRITPIKKKLLQTVGFTETEVENIQEWIDGKTLSEHRFFDDLQERFDKIDRLFQSRWPQLSLLEGSQVEVTASATTALPRTLNVQCDKGLELATRSKAAFLYKKCMQGKLSPQEISIEYVKLVQSHFCTVQQNLRDSIKKFNIFTLHAKKIFLQESSPRLSPKYLDSELKKIQSLWRRLQTHKLGVPKMVLPLSERYFLRGGDGTKREQTLSRLSTLRTRKVTLDGLEKEWSKYKQLLQELLNYATWEKEGSFLPDLHALVRYTSPRSKKIRTPTKEETLEMSWSLLQPAQKNLRAARTSRRLSLTQC